MTEHIDYAVTISDKSVVPASGLDNILKTKETNLEHHFYDFLNGNILTNDNKQEFYKLVHEERFNNKYTTTDHLITHVKYNDVNYLYVSLDNSVRANMNNFPLYLRIDALCEIVNKIILSFNNEKCIVFFSESSRPSFVGDMNNKQNIHSWFKIRNIIENKCNLKYIVEKRNNDDVNGMSFGISAFCTNLTIEYIDSYHMVSILNEGFGSGAVGIKMIGGEIIWAVNFPLDFKFKGVENLGHKTMLNLQKVMTDFNGSVFAFGDFNTIHGDISDSIYSAISEKFEFVVNSEELTFFGAFYDRINVTNEWKLISEFV